MRSRATSPPAAVGYLPQVHSDHAQVLADAALFDDAGALLRRALDMLSADGNAIEMAGALVTAAEIRLAQRDPDRCRGCRRRSGQLVPQAGRDGWVAVSTSLALQAAARDEQLSIELADQLEDVADHARRRRPRRRGLRSRLVASLVRVETGDEFVPDDPVSVDTPTCGSRTGR